MIDRLEAAALELIEDDEKFERMFCSLITITGIADRSAIRILGELACAPPDLTIRRLVAMAGLDPVEYKSGTSVNRKKGISRQGNRDLRQALYMPALCAIQRRPEVRRFYESLISRGKPKMVAVIAVMRKLLHCIRGMLKNNEPFDPSRFHQPKMRGEAQNFMPSPA